MGSIFYDMKFMFVLKTSDVAELWAILFNLSGKLEEGRVSL